MTYSGSFGLKTYKYSVYIKRSGSNIAIVVKTPLLTYVSDITFGSNLVRLAKDEKPVCA